MINCNLQRLDGPVRPLPAPGHEPDGGTQPGNSDGGGQPETRGGPGHHHDPTVHGGWGAPPGDTPPHLRPDRREAPDHRALEQFVDHGGRQRSGGRQVRRRWVTVTGRQDPEAAEPLVADATEGRAEEGVEPRERAPQVQVGVVVQDRSTLFRRGHRDRVLGTDGPVLPQQDHPFRAPVGDDPVVQRDDPGPDCHVEAEPAPQADRPLVQPGGTPDARVPLGGVGELCQVVEGLLCGAVRHDGSPVTGHWSVLSTARTSTNGSQT